MAFLCLIIRQRGKILGLSMSGVLRPLLHNHGKHIRYDRPYQFIKFPVPFLIEKKIMDTELHNRHSLIINFLIGKFISGFPSLKKNLAINKIQS